MSANVQRAVEALRKFKAAAEELDQHWHEVLNEGYPEGLPSFDEFTGDVQGWAEAVEEKLAK